MDLKIRDKRDKGWFYLDNEYLNGYAKVFGPVGTAIYVSLCRHADASTQTCFPSLELIAKENGIGSTNTVRKYLKLFERANIITSVKTRNETTKRWNNTVYTLLDKSVWKSHAQPLSMDSHAQLTQKSHAQPVSHKETHLFKETQISAKRGFSDFSVVPEEEKPKKKKRVDADLLEVFKLFSPKYPKNWESNNTQRKGAQNLLDEKGTEQIKKALTFYRENKETPFCPDVSTPWKLDSKWDDLHKFKVKNNL